eukprot:scaffold286692_cov21-Tisochrysis_lutea.AAC.1
MRQTASLAALQCEDRAPTVQAACKHECAGLNGCTDGARGESKKQPSSKLHTSACAHMNERYIPGPRPHTCKYSGMVRSVGSGTFVGARARISATMRSGKFGIKEPPPHIKMSLRWPDRVECTKCS